MSDWFSKVRNEQINVAKRITNNLADSVFSQPREVIEDIASDLLGFETRPLSDLDEGAFTLSLENEMKAHVLRAIHVYTDWLASKLVRDKNFVTQEIPVPTDKDKEDMNVRANVKPSLMEVVINNLHEVEGRIPMVGFIEDLVLVPDINNLNKWKELFDWSDEVEEFVEDLGDTIERTTKKSSGFVGFSLAWKILNSVLALAALGLAIYLLVK